uniref:Cadherin-12-like n=1 Tax=Gouania willdenowi TaxID=441366 RepID=A0A8C5GBU4_GOUWI
FNTTSDLHSDMDHGDSEVKYTLSGEGAGSIFTIDQITGDIHALVGLDRSEKAFYTLKAQAVDIHTGLALEPESQFIIKVQDINDNEPRFLDGPYSASVPEMSPTGTFVTQVTATDADDPTYGSSARIVYSIVQGQPYFSVDAKTGVIRTALANMDREVKQQYQVLLQAKDMGGQLGGLASTTTINISLSDVNDNPPRFTKGVFHLHVPESAAKGSSVGRIQAYDQDTGSNAWVDYAIIPGDDGDAFDVVSHQQSQEGVILVKKVDSRFLHLGPFKDSVTVKVSVVDVDEPPVFTRASYVMDVYEDSPPGIIIGSVTAQDLDPSSSGRVDDSAERYGPKLISQYFFLKMVIYDINLDIFNSIKCQKDKSRLNLLINVTFINKQLNNMCHFCLFLLQGTARVSEFCSGACLGEGLG